MRLGLFALVLLVGAALLPSVAAASEDADIVIVNSRNWHDLYLGSVHASKIGAQLLYFTNLGDAQLKTQTIRQNQTIVVYESSQPVVRNYASVLRTNGYSNYEVYEFSDRRELQRMLFEGADGPLVLLDPRYGGEALAFLPLAKTSIRPFFLDEETRSDVAQAQRSAEKTIIAGRFPVRLIEGIEADERYELISTKNANDITRMVAREQPSDWGVIMRIDRVDFASLLKTYPVVVYSGSLPETIETVRDTNITRFEIISADAADLGTQIRAGVGRDIRLMLKYGRTFTNLPGMTGQILDLDTIYVDFPSADLVLESLEHYTDADVILATYRNRGNTDTLALINIEYGNNALADPHVRTIPRQTTISVPYPLDVSERNPDAFVNARYGLSIPLNTLLLSDQGTPIVRRSVDEARSENISLELVDARYDDERGQLHIEVMSTQGVARIEIPMRDDLTFTNGPVREVDGRFTFIIDTPYHRAATFEEPITVVVYQGAQAPVYTQEFVVQPRMIGSRLTGSVTAVAAGALIVLLIILIVGFVVFVRRRSAR